MEALANTGGNHFAIYKCIKSTRCTLHTYLILYVNYISVMVGKKSEQRLSMGVVD